MHTGAIVTLSHVFPIHTAPLLSFAQLLWLETVAWFYLGSFWETTYCLTVRQMNIMIHNYVDIEFRTISITNYSWSSNG